MNVCLFYSRVDNQCFKLMRSVFETAAICKMVFDNRRFSTVDPKKANQRSLDEHNKSDSESRVPVQRATQDKWVSTSSDLSPTV